MTRLIALVLGVALLAGCAVTAPATQPGGDDYQGLANQAIAALSPYRGHVFIAPHGGDRLGHYWCEGSRITLGTAGNTRWLLAHELGHHINAHCDESLQHEIEANSTAIQVLQVWGDSEERAVYRTENHILGLVRSRQNNPLPGHNYCTEIAALVKEYPQYPFNTLGLCS